ncbi:MAG TPA: ABC transporter permease [Thermomicrobiales bacterium]|nr:ABC transporter permease [Thermomicrobiales bacterium]
MRTLALLRAFLRRDWVNETSYRSMLLIETLGVGSSLILFYAIGLLVGGESEPLQRYGGDYFPFALIGLAVSGYFSISLISASNRLRQAQTTGTLEAMFVTATPPSALLALSTAWDYLLATVRLAVFVTVGVIAMGVKFDINVWAALPVIVLSLASFASLGLIAASAILVVKRGDSIAILGNIVTTVFGGVLFPISLLPAWARPISYLVPLSWALDGLRRATLVGAGPRDIAGSLLALAISTALLVPLAWLSLRWATDRVRRDGSIGHY